MASPTPVRIAVVHDWLLDFAGSERVLAEILRCYPQADLFSLVDHLEDRDRALLGGKRAATTFLQSMPGLPGWLRYYFPLLPFAVEQLDVTNYDLVISSSHAVAKGVLVSPDALHVSYVHSPMRYAWDLQFAYLDAERMHGLRGFALRWLLHRLRQWDYRSAAGVDRFVANSHFVARRILKAYRRDAEVLHPPVDTEFFSPGGVRDDYYVVVSRLIGYKRVDLIVAAFAQLPALRLVVVGDGPQLARMKKQATPNVEFTGHVPADAVRDQLRRARAFVFAAIEDFGMAPVEAMACGTPVIALRRGGAAETVIGLDGGSPTGVFFEEQSADSVAAAVRSFEQERARISEGACRDRAERYSAVRFRSRFSELVDGALAQWRASLGR
jgi:glycosyltransferase involved in cell wall biosynthesis